MHSHDNIGIATTMLWGIGSCLAAAMPCPAKAQTGPLVLRPEASSGLRRVVPGGKAAAWNAAAPAVRCLLADGNTCWAAGDAGLILRSDDAGRTWRRLTSPVAANFQAVSRTNGSVYLFGGRAVPGQPEGAGLAAIIRTDDGTSFEKMPTGAAGWLYGGVFARQAGVVYGQATPACPGGVWRSAARGTRWSPLPVSTPGYLLGGDFHTFRLGWLVGAGHRIISVRRMREPRAHPPKLATTLSLRAARFADANVCWAAGENASLLRSTGGRRPWSRIRVPVPRGLGLLADFEAVATAPPGRIWVAGGLLGVVAHSGDGGRNWQLLPAPGPGPIHALAHVSGRTLLAAGDAGRIWHSPDGGKRWKLLRGSPRTDVLFILGAADRTLYPAIVAHALAGAGVAVVYATRPGPLDGCPGDQPLRAAAAAAGAGGATVLTDFPSLAASPAAPARLSDKQILQAWSDELDIPARPQLLLQLTAAIRLYRPAVVAVGPDGKGPVGPRAENRLVARIAGKAAELAGRKDAQPAMLKAGLPPWTVRRVFVGMEENETWVAPWRPLPQRDRSDPPAGEAGPAAVIDAAVFPAGAGTNIEMLAQAAAWRLPWSSLLDRCPRQTRYGSKAKGRRWTLFTAGIAGAKLHLDTPSRRQRQLAGMSQIRFAASTRRTAAALAKLAAAAEKAEHPRTASLAADRILLVWARLLQEGDLVRARQAMLHFLKFGRGHPLYRRMNVVALADSVSAEWRAQALLRGPPNPDEPKDYGPAVKRFGNWAAWSQGPPGRMLLARGLFGTGRGPAAVEVLKKLAAEPYPMIWRRRAEMELRAAENRLSMAGILTAASVRTGAEKGKLDGRLDEPAWGKARACALRAWGKSGKAPAPKATGTFQVVRSPTHVLLGLRLARAEGRVWTARLCIDSDRDAWTQLVLTCDTLGGRSARLVRRIGPPAAADPRCLLVQGRRGEKHYTLEIAVPLALTGTRPAAGGLWNFQLIAEASDHGKRTTLYFRPQEDARMLPERYGLLFLPPWKP